MALNRAATEKDWTRGSVFYNLLLLSWPAVVSQTLNMIGPTVDMIWVGKLGAAAIAGVGISGMAITMVNSLMMGLFTGVRAMIARFFGAGDIDGANHVAQQAFVIGAAFSFFMALIGIFLAEPILSVFGVEADVVAEGAAYMRIQLTGIVTMSLFMMAQSTMQASGDTVTPMKIAVLFRIFHVILCPLLIFGTWIFPEMGVSGAAVTNVISQGIGAVIGLWVLFRGHTRIRLTLKGFRLDKSIIWRLVRIGLPASISGVHRMSIHLVLVWFMAPFGTAALAAHSLVQRVDTFVQTPSAGLGQSSGILAAQNLGAGQPDRAEKSGWMAVGLFTVLAVVISVAIWFWGDYVVRIFSTEPEIVEIAFGFLRIQTVGYLMFGLAVGISLCVEGVGDTLFTMIITLISMWAIQVPLAGYLPQFVEPGYNGVRWAMVIALAFRAVTYGVYFRMGRWKRRKV